MSDNLSEHAVAIALVRPLDGRYGPALSPNDADWSQEPIAMPNRLPAPLIAKILTIALLCAASVAISVLPARAAAQDDAPGSLTVLTVNGDDEPVPGACYDLFVDEDGPTDFVAEQCDAYDGAADGTTVFADIPSGDYVLVQLFVPAGYKTGQDRSIAILAGEAAEYAFRTPRGGSTVALSLLDDGEQPLPGGCYTLYPVDTSGQLGPAPRVACDFYDGADDGATTIAGLDQGRYVVMLSSPPEGYTIPTGQSIGIEGEDIALEFDSALGGETVTIASVDGSGEPVLGSCHRLYTDAGDGARGDLVAVACDRSDGADDGTVAVIGLVPGAYVLAAPGPPAPPAPPAGDGPAGEISPASEPTTPADIPFEVVAGEGAQVEVVSLPAGSATPAA
jgi:hypothetical protein